MTTPVIRAALERLLHDLMEGKVLDGAIADADAALAEQPARPTDEELLQLSQWHQVSYTMSDGCVIYPLQPGTDMRDAVLSFARAVWDLAVSSQLILDNSPQLPADGEVAELAAELRHFVANYQQIRGLDPEHIYSIHRGDDKEAHLRISRLSRIADLLEQRHPTPIPVAERLPGPEDCIQRSNDHWCWGQERSSITGRAAARWRLMRVSSLEDEAVGWLPANALPVPTND
jgi:hypothetical protein